jgi:hypothetical protein
MHGFFPTQEKVAYWSKNTGYAATCDVKRDQYDNLYIVDSNSNCVLLFCQNPSSVVFDSDLNSYVSDYSNCRVLQFTRIV